MSEYPVVKEQIQIGKILNFTVDNQKFKIVNCDGVCYGEKGFILECVCISSPSEDMIGEKYSFDDRIFREYNNNKIVIEDK